MKKELSDKLKVKRGFERTMGKTQNELMELKSHPQQKLFNKGHNRKIGYFKYDSKEKIEKFVYAPKYRLIRFINQTHSNIKNYFRKK